MAHNSGDSELPDRIYLLRKIHMLESFSDDEIQLLASILEEQEFSAGTSVITKNEPGDCAYIVSEGEFFVEKFDHILKIYTSGEIFGEIALLDNRPRTATIKAKTDGRLLVIQSNKIENDNLFPATMRAKLYKAFSRQISSYIRQGSDLYEEMDVLLIQDGGCAPGYNPATAYISEYLEKLGRQVFIAAEGFRSVVSGSISDFRCLIYSKERFNQMDHIPGVIFSPPLRSSRGAEFRTERFKEFKNPEIQKTAAQNIIKRKIRIIVGIGGNGTFAGIKALGEHLPEDIKLFFVPVTIDSDVYGTACIGEHTGIEVGSEKIRCYMADARTHNRCYIIEMMGARGGFHALHSCLGAGAHLAVLPSSHYDTKRLVEAINPREETVIVVAEGYKSEQRKKENYKGNAAEYFRDELVNAGLDTKQRVICEPFSRDIRGAAPNNMDITLAQRMARRLAELVKNGENRVMPAVEAGRESSIPFDEIKTDNSVESRLASLANRLF